MRTTVDIDAELLVRLRAEVNSRGMSFKQALNLALRRGLDGLAEQLERYECPTFAMGEPLRPLDNALALADALQDEETARARVLRG